MVNPTSSRYMSLGMVAVAIFLATNLLGQQPSQYQPSQYKPPLQQLPFNGEAKSSFQSPDPNSRSTGPEIIRPPTHAAGTMRHDSANVAPASWSPSIANSPAPLNSSTDVSSKVGLLLKPPSAEATDSRLRKPTSTWASTISMFVSLSIVIALFMGVAWFFRGVAPQSTRSLPKDVVQVLGKTQLAARHNMILIRFGRKLLLVSQQLGQTATLSEIDDPREVDHLLGLCEQNSSSSISRSFLDVMTQVTSGKPIERSSPTTKNPSIAHSA